MYHMDSIRNYKKDSYVLDDFAEVADSDPVATSGVVWHHAS